MEGGGVRDQGGGGVGNKTIIYKNIYILALTATQIAKCPGYYSASYLGNKVKYYNIIRSMWTVCSETTV